MYSDKKVGPQNFELVRGKTWYMVLRIYCLQYSKRRLETSSNIYFPLFLFAHVLVQVFMKPLIPNLLGYNISVRMKFGQNSGKKMPVEKRK